MAEGLKTGSKAERERAYSREYYKRNREHILALQKVSYLKQKRKQYLEAKKQLTGVDAKANMGNSTKVVEESVCTVSKLMPIESIECPECKHRYILSTTMYDKYHGLEFRKRCPKCKHSRIMVIPTDPIGYVYYKQ